jgi:hypothetical protein
MLSDVENSQAMLAAAIGVLDLACDPKASQ